MSKLRMPEPYISGISPISSSFQPSDDAATLAKAHAILRSPVRLQGLKIHLNNMKSTLGAKGLKKVNIKGVGMRTIGVKR